MLIVAILSDGKKSDCIFNNTTTVSMLDTEIKYYLKNEDKFLAQYNGKYLVIQGKDVYGVYNSHAEAYSDARKDLRLGTFLIQHCVKGELIR